MSIWTSAGSVVRAEGELGMLNQEQMRITRQSNMIATSRGKEQKGVVDQADTLKVDTDQKSHATKSAEHSKSAAQIAMLLAVLKMGMAIGTGAAGASKAVSEGASVTGQIVLTILKCLPSMLAVLGALLNYFSISEEVDSLEKQTSMLEASYSEEAKMVKGMDTNPAG